MTALAAIRMGVDVRLLMPKAEGGEAPFSGVTVDDWTDARVLADWAAGCDAVTVESEWAQELAQSVVSMASPKPPRGAKRRKSTKPAKPSGDTRGTPLTNATTIEPSRTLVVQVVTTDGTTVGALGVAFAKPRKCTVIHRARLRDLARCAAKLAEAAASEPLRRSA